ncbi:MAG: DUF4340 domain-containing protein [Deltaproteobacteria bacterium]|jgi:hypothetical protein|nr:DUF4340 domain-containing protein [Deltaproteobacteria bacterium]MBW2536704.1 DUF4340 domain-containing protein [Deltaproteobacteria bacterium]
MKTEHKLYAAIAVVVVLGIAVYMSRKEDKAQQEAHSAAAAPSLPKVALSPEQIKKVTKVEIKNKDKGDVVLVKAEDAPEEEAKDDADAGADKKKDDKKYGIWKLEKPLAAEVNQSNVNSMLDNLEKIELREVITKTADLYEKYEVDGDKAVHVVAYDGKDKVFDMWFGKSGGRGQLARVAGTDGVFVAKGYQGYLYTREVKHWRNTEVWKFEDKNAIQVQIENEHGKFSFTKGEEEWAATFAERDEGKLSARAEALEKFDAKKLESMLRAYKTLRATDFAEEGAETGLEDPAKNGGTVTITLKDDAGTFALKVGKKAKNDDRFAQVEGKEGPVYVLSSWTAKWAIAEPKEFQQADEKDAKDEDADEDENADDEDAKDDDAKDDDAKGGDTKDKPAAPKPKAPAPKPKAPAPKPKAPAPKPKGGDTPYD